jgi:hypothetical protein
MSIRVTSLAHAFANACNVKAENRLVKRVAENIKTGVGVYAVRHSVKVEKKTALKYIGRELGMLARS